MSNRIVVDPVTRIEGHLRVQAVLGDDGKLADAYSTGTMWRGLEVILKGRDPRDAWAFVERICGVCTGIHALAAVRSVEDAVGWKIPKNANIIRNLINATLYTQDHVTHFYQLHALDWVDVVSALSADPRETAAIQAKISPHHQFASVGYFSDIQRRLKDFVATGQLSIFKNGYWGHAAMKLPPAVNLLATAHYLEALDFQREVIKVHTILGGKNPHPNYLCGGVPCPINVHDSGAAGNGLNEVTLNYIRDIAKMAIEFVNNVYIPDLKAIASFYPEWTKVGGYKNFLCFGDFPEIENVWDNKSLQMPMGAVLNGDINNVMPVNPRDVNEIQEFVDHSWFRYADGKKGLHPWQGDTIPQYELPKGAEGTKTKFSWLTTDGKYTWVKAPRWKGHCPGRGLDQGTRSCPAQGTRPAARGCILHARPYGCPRSGNDLDVPEDAPVRERPHRQHQGWRRSGCQHGQVGTLHLAEGMPWRWPVRSSSRRPGPLVRHQGRPSCQLAGHRPDDLERLSALGRRSGCSVRSHASRHPHRRPGPPGRNPSYDPLV